MEDLIAVLGATGRTGGATVQHLRRRGVPVRALTRTPTSPAAHHLHAIGAEVRQADMDSTDSLTSALEGVTRLLNVQPAFDGRGRYRGDHERAQGAAVARAAGAVGVHHVVQVAAGPGEPTGVPHFDAKLEIRRRFEERGIPVTALHPAPFMELMTDPAFVPALSVWGVEPRIVGWDRPLPWVAVDDIGRVAADSLAASAPSESCTLELIGDLRSLRECRQLLTDAGRRPRRVPVPTWLFRSMVGNELVEMWRWVTHLSTFAITPGLLDVPGWVARLHDPAPATPA